MTIISKNEVRPGDKIRLTREHEGVVYDTTLTVAKVESSLGYWFFHTGKADAFPVNGRTITLLERPKPVFKVGDRVRRKPYHEGGVTIEFTIHRIDHGMLYPAYAADGSTSGVGYFPDRFQLVTDAPA